MFASPFNQICRLACVLVLAPLVCAQTVVAANDNPPLKNLTLEQLGQIQVTTQSKMPEQRRKVAAAIYVLTQDDIRRAGVTNLPDALRLVPGVEVARVNGSRNWAVGIRGFGDQFSKSVLVLIDGRNVYTPLFAGVLWTIENVMLEDVDRIEVIRGPGGTIWGSNAVNGVINIITKSAKETQGGLVSLGGGNVDQTTDSFRYGGGNGKDFYYRIYGMGFLRGAEFHPDNKNYDHSRLGQVGFRADWERGRDTFTLQGDTYIGSFGDAQTISSFTPPSAFISYDPTETAGGNLLGRWQRELSERSSLYLQAYWMRDNRLGSNFGEVRNTFDVDFLHRLPLGTRNELTYGAGLRISPSTYTVTAAPLDFLPHQQTASLYSGFIQDELTLAPERLSLTLGSKFESNNYTGLESQPSGRLLWTPNAKNSFWAAVNRAVRTPSRIDEDAHVELFFTAAPQLIYAEVLGNRNIRAERSLSYEIGYRGLVHPRFAVDVDAFINAYHDVVAQGDGLLQNATTPPARLVVVFPYVNGVRGRTAGFELAPDWKPTDWWQVRSSYSYLTLDLKNQTDLASLMTRNRIQGSSPHHEVTIHSSFDLPRRFEFDQIYRYVSSLKAQNVDSYHGADLRLAWHFLPQWELSLTGRDLLRPHHAEFGIDPAPTVEIKRSVFAKIVWSSR